MPKEQEVKFVALLKVSWPGDYQEVRTFDTAWHLAMKKARIQTPVTIELLRFIRKD